MCKSDLAHDLEFILTQVKGACFVLVEVHCGSQEGSEQESRVAYIHCYGYLCLLFPEQSQL